MHGKEATVVVETWIRFDEEETFKLARHLHESGAIVVYVVVGIAL